MIKSQIYDLSKNECEKGRRAVRTPPAPTIPRSEQKTCSRTAKGTAAGCECGWRSWSLMNRKISGARQVEPRASFVALSFWTRGVDDATKSASCRSPSISLASRSIISTSRSSFSVGSSTTRTPASALSPRRSIVPKSTWTTWRDNAIPSKLYELLDSHSPITRFATEKYLSRSPRETEKMFPLRNFNARLSFRDKNSRRFSQGRRSSLNWGRLKCPIGQFAVDFCYI